MTTWLERFRDEYVRSHASELTKPRIREPAVPGRIRHRVADGAVGLAALVLTALADAGYGQTRRDVTNYERGE